MMNNINIEDFNILVRFVANIIAITLIVRGVYFQHKRDNEYIFTFFVFNILIFFICYVMNNVKITMGFGFGLFALFGLLRYRTSTIPIKDMTYLFTAITIALINSITPLNIELIFINLGIICSVYFMERIWFNTKEMYKSVQYEKLDLIQNGDDSLVIQDLVKRTNHDVIRFEVKSINFLNDSANLKIFYIPKR